MGSTGYKESFYEPKELLDQSKRELRKSRVHAMLILESLKRR